MTAWRWVGLLVTQAIHDRQLAEHGGAEGIRDIDGVESALARPPNLVAYGERSSDIADAAALAAAYAHGLARTHGFVDGNKRTAWIVARLFLADNGYRLRFDAADAVRLMEAVAAGTLSEPELSAWFRARLAPRKEE